MFYNVLFFYDFYVYLVFCILLLLNLLYNYLCINMGNIKILSIASEQSKSEYMDCLLKNEGFDILCLECETDAYKSINTFKPDMILLDSDRINFDFFQFVATIRSVDLNIPILFCTSWKEESYYLKALTTGVNVCIQKNISEEYLQLQIRSIIGMLERHKVTSDDKLILGNDSSYNVSERELLVDNFVTTLTALEGRLFRLLCYNINNVTHRNALLMAGWGNDDVANEVQLNKYIVKFRKLISVDSSVRIMTIKGLGYKFELC